MNTNTIYHIEELNTNTMEWEVLYALHYKVDAEEITRLLLAEDRYVRLIERVIDIQTNIVIAANWILVSGCYNVSK